MWGDIDGIFYFIGLSSQYGTANAKEFSVDKHAVSFV